MKMQKKVNIGVLGGILASAGVLGMAGNALAETTTVTGENGYLTTDDTVKVVVPEILTIKITTPTTMASGGSSDFLRNYYLLDVMSNNAKGWSTTMTTDESSTDANSGTALAHKTLGTSYFVPTLTAATTRENFIASNGGYWGYSTDDTGKNDNSSSAVNTSATYSPLVAKDSTAISLSGASSSAPGEVTEDIYFGMMPSASLAAGTYAGTVLFNVIAEDSSTSSDVHYDNTTIASDTTNWSGSNGTYTSTVDSGVTGTSSTTSNSDGSETSTVTVKDASPLGVSTESTVSSTNVATGAMAAVAVAGTALIMSSVFFVGLAERPEEGEDEE